MAKQNPLQKTNGSRGKRTNKTARPTQRAIAESFLRSIAADIGIPTDLKNLKYDQVKETILGKHVLFQQHHAGKPISGAWVRVDIDPNGSVFNVQNDLVPEAGLAKAAKKKANAGIAGSVPVIKEAAARVLANKLLSAKAASISKIELMYWPVDGVPRLAYKVVARTTDPPKVWRLFIDANTGKLLQRRQLQKHARVMGRIFDPSPVATLSDSTLSPRKKIPETAYKEVALRGLKGNGRLDGEYCSTRLTKRRVKSSDGHFRFNNRERGFLEVMVYYHVDAAQRHLQKLGFKNVLNKPIRVDADGYTQDNSFYFPDDQTLLFGTGGVDDAEDAEVILHEYGHAIQDAQVPGFGDEHEGQAMGEGFGDFFAASFFRDRKPTHTHNSFALWDGVLNTQFDPPSCRRLDTKRKYKQGKPGEVHDDGEIWSACLWELRDLLGTLEAQRLVIASHFLLTRSALFADGANAILVANKQLNKGAQAQAIKNVFVRRGILKK